MCSHVFCQQCLVGLVGRDQWRQASINCPTCRHRTLLTGNGVNSLPSAVHISQLLDILKEHKAGESAKAKKVYYCFEHDRKEVDLYCETCRELICWKCIKKTGKHHSHEYDELDDAVEKFKKELNEAIKPLEKKVEAAVYAFDVCHKNVAEQRVAIEGEIRSNIKKLHEHLDARQEQLLGQLDLVIQDNQESLRGQRKQLETIQSEIVQLKNTAVEERSHEEILIYKASRFDKVKDIATDFQLDTLKPNVKVEVQFSSSADIFELCQTYGKLERRKQEVTSSITKQKLSACTEDQLFLTIVGGPVTEEDKLKESSKGFDTEFERGEYDDPWEGKVVSCHQVSKEDEFEGLSKGFDPEFKRGEYDDPWKDKVVPSHQERREKGRKVDEWPPKRKGRSNKSNWRRKN